MARPRKEWIGKNDAAMPPPRIRQRIYDDANGICHICRLSIKTGETWHADHVKALIDGGENRETNLAPAHPHCNLAKGVEETKRARKSDRQRQKHIGIKRVKQPIKSRGFETAEKADKKINKSALPELPRRRVYGEKT